MTLAERSRTAGAAAAVLASAAVLVLAGMADPLCNWDLVAYTACSLELAGEPDSSLHEETYRLLERSVPAPAYSELTGSTASRQTRASDPASLMQHLPFYRPRIAYTALLAALHLAGMDPLSAASAVSVLAALATLLLLLTAFPRRGSPGLTAAIAIGSLGTGLVEVARHATPDALAALCVVASSALLLRGRRAALVMLPVCVLVRTDLVLFVLPVSACALAMPPFQKMPTLISAAFSTALVPLLHNLAGGYGWGATFEYTFLGQCAYPALLSGSVTPADYISVARGSIASIPHSEPWVFLFASAVALGLSAGPREGRRSASSRGAHFLLLACGVSAVLHFLVFPAAWLRFFAGQFSLALLLAAFLCLDRASPGGQ